MKSINSYLEYAQKNEASDVHLVSGSPAMVRVHGQLHIIEDTPLAAKELKEQLYTLINTEQKKRFEEELELDVSYEHKDTRYRINLHMQDQKIAMAARLIPSVIPTPEELRFEPALTQLPNYLHGLVLVVGATGNGKSTTLASMVQEINKNRKAHIVTVEDPVEFAFEQDQSLIEQREVGVDTKSFANALKHVLRQDPDVILVGEMRDPETIATVLTAAETGHLVFSTLHTNSAAEAIERIVDVFDGSKQKQILIQLSTVLRAVVAQELLPTIDGKRVAAREILINTPAVANMIRENNIAQIPSTIQTQAKLGMVPMNKSIEALVKEGLISKEVAERHIQG